MTDPVELELQLRITDKNSFEGLLADPFFKAGKPKCVAFETTYFDTAEHRLQENGLAYRIRKSADGFTATIKNRGTDGGGLFARNEWNRPVDSQTPSVDAFGDLPVGKRLAEIVGLEALQPIFTTIVRRTSVLIAPMEGSEIELSADIGEITCGERSEDICEIELELKNGSARRIFDAAEELASRHQLLPEEKSKYLRGLLLAGLAKEVKDSAEKQIHFDKHTGYRILSGLLLHQLDAIAEAQGAFIQSPLSPKNVHQLRISVRTFRSLLYLLKPLFEPKAYEAMQKEFSSYIRRFSKIRDLDVLMRALDAYRQKNPDAVGDTSEFLQWIQAENKEANKALHLELSGGSATPMLMRAKKILLQFGEGQDAVAEDQIYSAVCSRFRKKLETFRKDFKNTDFKDTKAVHVLRIQCKKLNYSLQFINAGKKEETSTEKKLKKMQKVFGKLCDISSFMRIAADFDATAQGRVLEEFVRRQTAEREKLRKKASRLEP